MREKNPMQLSVFKITFSALVATCSISAAEHFTKEGIHTRYIQLCRTSYDRLDREEIQALLSQKFALEKRYPFLLREKPTPSAPPKQETTVTYIVTKGRSIF